MTEETQKIHKGDIIIAHLLMDCDTPNAEALRRQIVEKERELEKLKATLARVESQTIAAKEARVITSTWPLSPDEYRRYGRQLIVPGFGIEAQLRLKSASVLIVGVGGLGCPAAAYLAGAGIGTLGLVDVDVVESSNFHRQILHNESTKGMKKVDSAIIYLKRLNPHPQYRGYPTHLTPENAEQITSEYDLVLDCTDHPTSRYLISDICCLLRKPLISASALRYDGQLTILNWPPLPAGDENGGPCYRCLFPKPPPPDTTLSCGESGILGPVVGVMGVLQALNAVQLVMQMKLPNLSKDQNRLPPSMLLFSTNSSPQFRSLKLKGRRKGCSTCSNDASLSLISLRNGAINYKLFCGISASGALMRHQDHIEIAEYARQREEDVNHLLIDVRDEVEFNICNLPGSINLPFSKLQNKFSSFFKEVGGLVPWVDSLPLHANIYVICRLGNDSQLVTKKIKDISNDRIVKNVRGGFKAWRDQIDPSWPEY